MSSNFMPNIVEKYIIHNKLSMQRKLTMFATSSMAANAAHDYHIAATLLVLYGCQLSFQLIKQRKATNLYLSNIQKWKASDRNK
jgi:hypothetical protein